MGVVWGIGDVVRKVRDAKGWGQRELAEASGVGLSSIQRIEDGQSFRSPTLAAIAEALGTTASALHAMVPTPPTPISAGVRSLLEAGFDRLPPKKQAAVVQYVQEIQRAAVAVEARPPARGRG